jgi:hypothetical protein
MEGTRRSQQHSARIIKWLSNHVDLQYTACLQTRKSSNELGLLVFYCSSLNNINKMKCESRITDRRLIWILHTQRNYLLNWTEEWARNAFSLFASNVWIVSSLATTTMTRLDWVNKRMTRTADCSLQEVLVLRLWRHLSLGASCIIYDTVWLWVQGIPMSSSTSTSA